MLWTENNFIRLLQNKMLTKLPGLNAQLKMAPPSRKTNSTLIPTTVNIAGVMIVLYLKNKEWHLLLMQRTKDGGTHSGQISLPGGKVDKQDRSITYTAIRELQEEMGIAHHSINIIGNLTPLYIPLSNFLITPTICFWQNNHSIIPNNKEVEMVLEIPLHQLFHLQTKNIAAVKRSDDKTILMQTPMYFINKNIKIWGATAMVLSELEELLLR